MRIRLLGALEKFGGPYEIKRRSAMECWRILAVQIPGLVKEVLSHPEIAIIADGECLDRDLLSLQMDAEELIFLPVPRGAWFAAPAIVAGATAGGVGASIGAGAITTASIAAASGAATGFGGFLSAVGVALSGISAGTWLTIASTALSLGLSLAQSSSSMSPRRDPNGNTKAQSYSFNGVVNNAEEGQAIPLVVGKIRTGGAVISFTQFSKLRVLV